MSEMQANVRSWVVSVSTDAAMHRNATTTTTTIIIIIIIIIVA